MAEIPKYVIELLKKRTILSRKLRVVCCELDDYCRKIGVDFNDPDACLMSDVRIYCEEDAAYSSTKKVIEKTLARKDQKGN